MDLVESAREATSRRRARGPAVDVAEPDRAPKLAERLAARIEREVLQARWPVGEVIGTEPALVARYGVSRAIFREAVRILEHHGVVEMRRGPSGGLVVTAPDADAITRAATLYLAYKDVAVSNLFEARLPLELLSVDRVARGIDEAGIERLRDVLLAEASTERAGHHSHEFHHEVAQLSGNPVLALFIHVLVSLTEQRLSELRTLQQAQSAEPDQKGLVGESRRAHHAIVEAIVRGDAALAQHRMRRHIEGMPPYLRETENGSR
jgi:DNA-binding FadR family transcriptional regulator